MLSPKQNLLNGLCLSPFEQVGPMWNLELFSDQSRNWSKRVIGMYVPHGILKWVISEMVY